MEFDPQEGGLQVIKKFQFAKNPVMGVAFDDVFLVEEITEKTKKDGSPYWDLTLRDRTGTISAKLWDSTETKPLTKGTFVKVRAEGSMYKDKPQLTLKLIRPLDTSKETVDMADFVPTGPNDRYQQIGLLRDWVACHVAHPGLFAICDWALNSPEMEPAFRDAPAAKGNHHAYIGGLVDHVLSMARISVALGEHYGLGPDQRSLLIAACVFHDIGKVRELSWKQGLGYTSEGQLVGHVTIGAEILSTVKELYRTESMNSSRYDLECYDKDSRLFDHLRHLIASHHGNLEWGAAVTPKSREAALFHLIDMIDSRMGVFDAIDSEPADADGFTPWNKALGGPSWRA